MIERRARSALHCIAVLLGGTRDQRALLNILTAALANDVSIQVCTHCGESCTFPENIA